MLEEECVFLSLGGLFYVRFSEGGFLIPRSHMELKQYARAQSGYIFEGAKSLKCILKCIQMNH